MHTSVVIVSHRTHHWLERSIESVRHQADEVVLVDNASPGEEVSAVGRRSHLRTLRSTTNLGFAGGANLGLSEARGELVALLNDDAMAEPGWLASAANILADESIAAVAPKTVFALPHAELRFDDEPHFAPGDPRPLGRCIYQATLGGKDVMSRLIGPGVHQLEHGQQGPAFRTWRWTAGKQPIFVPIPEGTDASSLLVDGAPAPVVGLATVINNAGSYLSAEGFGGDYGFGAPDDGAFDKPANRFAASGVAMVMRRETVSRLGQFPDRFFSYYEDLDWCWRAQRAGMRIRYDPTAVVRHVGGVTSGGPRSEFVRFLAARNRILTLARNAPLVVIIRQLRRAMSEHHQPSLQRSLAGRLPEALIQRLRLSHASELTPADVWRKWAGVGETWVPAAS